MIIETKQTRVYQTAEIRALEKAAIEEVGIPALLLMERAAKAAFHCLQTLWPKAKTLGVVCGSGNNGGDGYALALEAKAAGYTVFILHEGFERSLKEPAKTYAKACLNSKITAFSLNQTTWPICDVWVDALLGLGLTRAVDTQYRKAIRHLNQEAKAILSLDCPSGLDSSLGIVRAVAVKASATISFIGLKLGLLTAEGPEYCGRVYCDDLNLPEDLFKGILTKVKRIDYSEQKSLLPARKAYAHKGDFGRILVIGGDFGMPGAPILSAEAALRVGAGLVMVATRPEHVAALAARRPEALVYGISHAAELKPLLSKCTAIVLGPGLGLSSWSKEMFNAVIKIKLPLLLDADALNILAEYPFENQRWILTPHVGEAARLLNSTVEEIQGNRLHAIAQLQHQYGGTVVLKGAGSLIMSSTEKEVLVCTEGNPGMATAGMGDVLTGIISGLWAQGLAMNEAAALGVYLHACAGDKAAEKRTRGLLASDLIDHLPTLLS